MFKKLCLFLSITLCLCACNIHMEAFQPEQSVSLFIDGYEKDDLLTKTQIEDLMNSLNPPATLVILNYDEKTKDLISFSMYQGTLSDSAVNEDTKYLEMLEYSYKNDDNEDGIDHYLVVYNMLKEGDLSSLKEALGDKKPTDKLTKDDINTISASISMTTMLLSDLNITVDAKEGDSVQSLTTSLRNQLKSETQRLFPLYTEYLKSTEPEEVENTSFLDKILGFFKIFLK